MFEEENSTDKEEKYETFGFEDENDIRTSQTYTNRMLRKRRLERKQRKGNIWISRLHVLLRMCILAGLIYGFYCLIKAPQWYIDKDTFTTTSPYLEIKNNDIVPTIKILNELRKISVVNEPIYKFDTGKIRSNLLELEPIENIYIRRYWFPARFQIIVQERVPLISLYTSNDDSAVGFYTKDGVLIGSDYLPLPNDKPTIKVLVSANYREWDKTKIETIKKIVDYAEQISKSKVEYIDLRNEKDIYIKLENLNLRAGSIDDGIYDRLIRLSSIIPQLKKVNKEIQYIDLRWKNAAYIKTL